MTAMPARATSSRQSPPHSDYGIASDRYDDLLDSLRGLAEQIQAISQHAAAAYTPVVASIIRD